MSIPVYSTKSDGFYKIRLVLIADVFTEVMRAIKIYSKNAEKTFPKA